MDFPLVSVKSMQTVLASNKILASSISVHLMKFAPYIYQEHGPDVVATFQYVFPLKKRLNCLSKVFQSIQSNRHDNVKTATKFYLLRLTHMPYIHICLLENLPFSTLRSM